MKIEIRTRPGNGFWREVTNKRKTHCDICGEKLWVNPGGGVYCNSWIADHDQPGRYETLREERRGNVTVKLVQDSIDRVHRLEWVRAGSDEAVGEDAYQTYEDTYTDFDGAFVRHALETA